MNFFTCSAPDLVLIERLDHLEVADRLTQQCDPLSNTLNNTPIFRERFKRCCPHLVVGERLDHLDVTDSPPRFVNHMKHHLAPVLGGRLIQREELRRKKDDVSNSRRRECRGSNVSRGVQVTFSARAAPLCSCTQPQSKELQTKRDEALQRFQVECRQKGLSNTCNTTIIRYLAAVWNREKNCESF